MNEHLSLSGDIQSWQLEGELSVFALSEDWEKLDKKRPISGKWIIDCQLIDKVDSAGIAYLISCMRYAKAKSVALTVVNMPEEVNSLIQAQGISKFFS